MKKTNYAFSAKAINSETPRWAKNMFRITLLITSAITIFMAGTNILEESMKYEVLLGLKTLDAFMFGLSKMFGVEYEKKN